MLITTGRKTSPKIAPIHITGMGWNMGHELSGKIASVEKWLT